MFFLKAFFILLALKISPVFSQEHGVSDAVRELGAITQQYKKNTSGLLRRNISTFVQTGNFKRYRGINYKRLATPAERLIMMDAIITAALRPTYDPSILEEFETSLRTCREPLAYGHHLTIYSVAQLAKYDAEGKDRNLLVEEMKPHINPAFTPNLAEYLDTLYRSNSFQQAFAQNFMVEYHPDLKPFMAEEEQRRIGEGGIIKRVLNEGGTRLTGPSTELNFNITRTNLDTENRHGENTPIYYDVILPNVQPKGVIIDVYGADGVDVGGPLSHSSEVNSANEYNFLATEGYIYYRLYPRGSRWSGYHASGAAANEAFNQSGTDGIFTLVRDVAYFAAQLQYDDAWIRKKSPPTGYIKASGFIKGKKIPIILTGSSFGGYLTLMTATSNENITVVKNGQEKTKTIAEIFDAYIPKAPLVDLWEDVNFSPTAISDKRRELGFSGWFPSAYPELKLKDGTKLTHMTKESADKYSVYDRLIHLKRPVLLIHGLNDNNTSPQSVLNLVKKAEEHGVEKYVSLSLEGEVGHFVGMRESSDKDQGAFRRRPREYAKYLERVFKFLDLVRFYTKQDSVFTLSVNDVNKTKSLSETAPMLMAAYSTDEGVHSPFERLMMGIVKSVWDGTPESALKGVAALESIATHDGNPSFRGLGTLLIAALVDLKFRYALRNDCQGISEPNFNVGYGVNDQRKLKSEPLFSSIFSVDSTPITGAGAGAGAGSSEPSHVLERYSAWSNTCLKDPDKPGCDIDPRPYLEALKEERTPEGTPSKIFTFSYNMKKSHTFNSYTINPADPLKMVREILEKRLTHERYATYRELVRGGQDIFSTPILNGRLQ
jgi:hypothetical protein